MQIRTERELFDRAKQTSFRPPCTTTETLDAEATEHPASLFGSRRISRLSFRIVREMIPRSEVCPVPVLHIALEILRKHCNEVTN